MGRDFWDDPLAVVPLLDATAALALSELVHAGEAEAIALALERGVRRILMDDLAGRRLAKQAILQPIGTLGFLVQAGRTQRITSLTDHLDPLDAAGFRMTAGPRLRALELAAATESDANP